MRIGVDDEALLELIAGADKVGIDAPFGWPDEFVDAMAAHRDRARLARARRGPGRLPVPAQLPAHRQPPDRGGVRRPLSVSTDLIGVVAMRAANLLDSLAARGEPVDRAGSGKVVEVYPAPALASWGINAAGYKSQAGAGPAARPCSTPSRSSSAASSSTPTQRAAGERRSQLLRRARRRADRARRRARADLSARARRRGRSRRPRGLDPHAEQRARRPRGRGMSEPRVGPAAAPAARCGTSCASTGTTGGCWSRSPLVVLLPQAVADAAHRRHRGRAGATAPPTSLKLASIPLALAINLGGEALYAGIVAAAVVHWRRGRADARPARGRADDPLRAADRDRPPARDRGSRSASCCCVVPGVLVLTYLVISPALIEIERLTIREALAEEHRARPRELLARAPLRGRRPARHRLAHHRARVAAPRPHTARSSSISRSRPPSSPSRASRRCCWRWP